MSSDSWWPRRVWGDLGLPKLVLLHGFLGSSRDWESLAGELCEDYCVVALDLPGHGAHRLPVGGALSIETMADGLARQLEALGPVRAVLGYSLGGRVSLAVALQNAGLARSWWWESASPGLEGEALREARVRLDAVRAEEMMEDLPGFLERWYRAPLFCSLRDVPEAVWEALWARRVSNRVEEVARVIEAVSPGRAPSQWGRLERLRGVDHVWLCGALDVKYREQLRRAGERSGGGLREVLGASHNVHVQRPVELAKVLRGELENPTARHKVT